jgi:glucosamine--fructose-6-phosphate aminotransferase (isomerizing)
MLLPYLIKKSNEIIAARLGSPLQLGGEYFIASDASPFIEYTSMRLFRRR